MNHIEIEIASPAWDELLDAFTDPHCATISLEIRQTSYGNGLAIKRDAGTWSPTLGAKRQ